MKHTLRTVLTLLLSTVFCISLYAESPKREFRATWLAAVGVDWPDNKVSSGTAAQITAQKNELIAYLDQLVASNQNAICYHVRPMADAFYQSNISLVPWSHYLTGTRGKSPGYDPLAFAIEEAHKRGLEIHAWLNPFRHLTSGLSSVSGVSSDPIKTQKPSWLLTYDNGSYSGTILDPGNPDVRAHIVAVVEDIITHYDVDGVIIDDYFYPYGGTTNEDATSKSKYKPSGQSDDDWRRDNIDTTIKGIYDMIQSKKPWVRFGASPFGIYSPYDAPHTKYGVTKPSGITGMDAYGVIYCNTLAWMDGGYVDYVSPQLYWATSSSGQSYVTLSKWWSDMAKHFSDKQSGGKKIHFFSSQDVATHGTTEIGNQINYNRQYNQQDAPGSIFFSYDDLKEKGFPAYLKKNKFTQLALPPAMDWKSTSALAAPSNVTLSGTTLSWSHPTAERFTVYAYTKGSDNATAIASSSNLVGVVYGNSLNVSSVSSYAAKTFAVCAYDRYGNEYNPGYYNLQLTTPTLTANPSSFTLRGKHGQTAPYIDIMIEGQNLISNISVNSTTGYVTLAKQSDWNDQTGGTLRATLSTSTILNNTGYIAVVSGTARIEIPFTIIVQELAPTLTASASSITLTGMSNSASAPYKDITITGEDLSSDIAISSLDIVSCKTLNWNARTGGTLRLTLNTSKAIGDHTGIITLSSGTASQAITVNATITDGPQPGKVSISQVWKQANPSYISTSGNNNRSIAYYDGKLYISVSDGNFNIVDASNGSLLGTKSLGVTSSYHGFNVRMTNDGQLLSGNSQAGSTTFTVFAVDKENGGGASKGALACTSRYDFFDAYGDWNGSGYIVSFSNSGEILYVPVSNGTLQTGNTKTYSTGLAGTSAKALAYDENSFYVQHASMIPKKYSISTGAVLEQFGSDVPSTGTTGMAIFTVAAHKYMITPADRLGGFDVFDITDGLNTATRVITTTAAIGSNTNSSATVDFATHVDGNDAYIYVLAPNNGVAAYKFTFTPNTPTLAVSNNSVSLSGKVNQSPAPYVDVVVSGSNLPSAISYTLTGSGFNVTKLSGWSDSAGGTLRITLNTGLAANTYTGAVTVKSGSHSRTINVTSTLNPLQPTITLGTTTVSLSAKSNATAPYRDVEVTASELSANLAIETSSDLVTVTKNSGWNNLTGGSIRITLNTAKTVGTHTATVTIKTGTISKTINVTGVINPLQPAITLDESSVEFSGSKGAVIAPYQDVTVSAQDLSSNLVIETSSNLVSVTKNSGWNDLTGGSIRLTLNTTLALGDYACTVTVKSGSVTKTITVNATIHNLEPKLSSNITSLSLKAEKDDAKPYQDIVITGSDLSSNISYSSNVGSALTITPQADWNSLSGGTLRVALATSSQDDYEGDITISSGSAVVTIPFTGEIASTSRSRHVVASTPSISLSVQQGAETYVDVVVTGKNMGTRYTISVSDDMSIVETETLDDWSSREGGTLRIHINTNTAGTYTGEVSLQTGTWSTSGSATISLNVTVAAVDTKIQASTTSISLSSEQNAVGDYKDVIISASDAMSDLTITTDGPITATPQADWDALTGGTLRIALETYHETGGYFGSVTVTSGPASVVISVGADIYAPEPKDGTITFDGNALWTKTPSSSNFTWLSTSGGNRSMSYYNGKLYISDKDNSSFRVVNANTGAFIETVNVGYNDFEQHNLRITDDGMMLFGNTGTASSTSAAIAVRSWNINERYMSELSESTIGARCDYFYPYGKWNESGFILALANTGAFVKIPFANGSLGSAQKLSAIPLQTEPDGADPKSAKAIPGSASTFYTTATYNAPVKYSIDGSERLDEFGGEQPASVAASGLGLFSIHGHHYMITPATAMGGFDIFDITDGLYNATRVVSTVPALGTNTNAAMTIDYCTRLDGNDVYIYEFVPNNGLRAYKFTFTPIDDPNTPDTPDVPEQTTPDVTYGSVSFYLQGGSFVADTPADNEALWNAMWDEFKTTYNMINYNASGFVTPLFSQSGTGYSSTGSYNEKSIGRFLQNCFYTESDAKYTAIQATGVGTPWDVDGIWEWLSDYICAVNSSFEGKVLNYAYETQSFLQKTTSLGSYATTDWTEAGKPASWQPAYTFAQQPYRSGYVFRGWFNNANGTGTALTTVPKTGNVYACWRSDIATTVQDVENTVVILPTVTGVALTFVGTQEIAIYNVNGMLVNRGKATDTYACDLQTGMYVIRVGGEVYKFVK